MNHPSRAIDLDKRCSISLNEMHTMWAGDEAMIPNLYNLNIFMTILWIRDKGGSVEITQNLTSFTLHQIQGIINERNISLDSSQHQKQLNNKYCCSNITSFPVDYITPIYQASLPICSIQYKIQS